MPHQDAPLALRRKLDQNWTDVLATPDFQFVFLIVLIGVLITGCLASVFSLDNNAISSIAILS
jgi:hypothetical protein